MVFQLRLAALRSLQLLLPLAEAVGIQTLVQTIPSLVVLAVGMVIDRFVLVGLELPVRVLRVETFRQVLTVTTVAARVAAARVRLLKTYQTVNTSMELLLLDWVVTVVRAFRQVLQAPRWVAPVVVVVVEGCALAVLQATAAVPGGFPQVGEVMLRLTPVAVAVAQAATH